jgi:hypothetical protein
MIAVLALIGFVIFWFVFGDRIRRPVVPFVATGLATCIVSLLAYPGDRAALIVLLCFGWVVLSIVLALLAKKRGESFAMSFLAALVLSPAVLALFNFKASRKKKSGSISESEGSATKRRMASSSPLPGYVFAAGLIGIPLFLMIATPKLFAPGVVPTDESGSSDYSDVVVQETRDATASGGVAEASLSDPQKPPPRDGTLSGATSESLNTNKLEFDFKCAWTDEIKGEFGVLRQIVCEDKDLLLSDRSNLGASGMNWLSASEMARVSFDAVGCDFLENSLGGRCALLVYQDDVLLASEQQFGLGVHFPETNPSILIFHSTFERGIFSSEADYILDLTIGGAPVLLKMSEDIDASMLILEESLRRSGTGYELRYTVRKPDEGPLGEDLLQRFRYRVGYGLIEVLGDEPVYNTLEMKKKTTLHELLDDPERRRPILKLLGARDFRSLRYATAYPQSESSDSGAVFEQLSDDIYIGRGCQRDCDWGRSIFAMDVGRDQAWVAMINDDLVHLYGRWADMSPEVRMAFDRWLEESAPAKATRVVHSQQGS